jgi:hypothetical protein
LKSGNINLLETPVPVLDFNGFALPHMVGHPLCLFTVHNIHLFLIKPYNAPPPPSPNAKTPELNKKFSNFTYVYRETAFITNIFKHMHKNSLPYEQSILNQLTNHTHPHKDQSSSSGVYKLIYPDCNMTYIGQTARK